MQWIQKKKRKLDKNKENVSEVEQKSRMIDLITKKYIFTLYINGLNTPNKKQRLSHYIKKNMVQWYAVFKIKKKWKIKGGRLWKYTICKHLKKTGTNI